MYQLTTNLFYNFYQTTTQTRWYKTYGHYSSSQSILIISVFNTIRHYCNNVLWFKCGQNALFSKQSLLIYLIDMQLSCCHETDAASHAYSPKIRRTEDHKKVDDRMSRVNTDNVNAALSEAQP